MGKRIVYTKITPLPSAIPRQLALDMLHSHGEVISLNPLVTGHKPISAPRDAAADEFFAQWYEISEIITWGFGMKKKIAFKGVFHDLPNGLQTHTYAPMGVDLRNKWTVRGNQPGEPREPRELGVEVPMEGLYLREDVEIVCNMALTGFVKKEMKAAAGIMVDRMTRKAELLDEGVLHAMFEDGKLKTTNPNLLRGEDALAAQARENFGRSPAPSSPGTMPGSPPASESDFSTDTKFGKYSDLPGRRQSSRASYLPAYQQEGYQGPEDSKKGHRSPYAPGQRGVNKPSYSPPAAVAEVEGSFYHPQQQQQQNQRQYSSPNVPTFQAELADTSIPAPAANDRPAPLNPHRNSQQSQNPVPSPQPSPGLTQRHSSSNSSPQIPERSVHRTTSAVYQAYNSGGAAPSQEARGLPNAGNYTIANPDPYSRHRSTDSAASNNLASRVQGLGITDTAENAPAAPGAADPSQFGGKGAVSKCPVCGNFEGDEAAVSHHVAKHFS